MANHFHSALEKITTEEASALVAPLMAVLLANQETASEDTAAADFVARYTHALAANGHELIWMAPNGRRFESDEPEADDEELAEVVGFADNRPPRRPELAQAQQWRGLAAAVTGGRIGMPLPGDSRDGLFGTTLPTVIG